MLLGIVGGLLLFTGLNTSLGQFKADELGLGLNTTAVVPETGKATLFGKYANLPELTARARALRAAGKKVALWLGASQLHSINNLQEGDLLAVQVADARARRRGSSRRYLQISEPNANLRELLAEYRAFRGESRPETLVLALTYDDLGETGNRFQGRTTEDLVTPVATRSRGGGRPTTAVSQPKVQAPIKRSATGGTPQEWLEQRLVQGLEAVWPGYANRGSARSWLIVSWRKPLTNLMYRLRGRPGSVPAPETAAKNLKALDEILKIAKQDGVRVLIYKPPHRPGEVPFYHPRNLYDAFFEQLQARCKREGLYYLDLETIVPTQYWGLTNNYLPDVFHFQAEGHRLLGEAIDGWFEEQDG